ncbi:HlyD family type I secretion periplasmic adaptor subunit [Agrobacterium tumefaciens]|uniref:HlyD family type I secretion periplasmic adaptor subunit n=1 Tax=Agrobacterium tumefaciens TaxID=358 RepID=UPI0021CF6F31|nr:HlyD family type I secretion periplasmic adaptor subunit [Agrobacterium tumefaciens]UXS05583.1 HlyD family type I secretion periplasmic adaptor subunit [Agrobacterium tumefaciens]
MTPKAQTRRGFRGTIKTGAGQRADMEFLPAALEILESPASPVRLAMLWFICLLATMALMWGWLGKFDIVATAQGKIQPVGRVKIIQSLESGKTKSVAATNGSDVKAGDILVELDDTELAADERAKTGMLHALQGEIVRRTTVLANINRYKTRAKGDRAAASITPALVFAPSIPTAVREREQALYKAEMRAIATSLDSLLAQRAQRKAELDGSVQTTKAQVALVETLNERVVMRSKLVQQASGSRAEVIDAVQQHQEALLVLIERQAQHRISSAAFDASVVEANKLLDTAAADHATRKVDAEHRVDELVQELVKIRKRRELLSIRSPIDGTVQLSSVTTIGQVIAPNTELMRIVPADARLEIEAFLPNKDIGFVSEGQSAIIKVEAYPFTRFGILEGFLKRISTDAVPEPDAQQMESTIAQNSAATIVTGNVPRVQNLVFPITIGLNETALLVEGQDMPIAPGMTVTVEIKTGQRRILEYLFSPLAQISSEAMTER